MKGILQKLLQRKGIESLEELSPEEKQTFNQWDEILSKEELTLEDVKDFCINQCEIIEGKWRDYNISNEKKAELIPYHTTYKTLLQTIKSPKVAREALERQLTQMLD